MVLFVGLGSSSWLQHTTQTEDYRIFFPTRRGLVSVLGLVPIWFPITSQHNRRAIEFHYPAIAGKMARIFKICTSVSRLQRLNDDDDGKDEGGGTLIPVIVAPCVIG